METIVRIGPSAGHWSSRPTRKWIAERMAARHGVSLNTLIGRSRQRRIVEARYAAIRACHDYGHSAASIGRFFDRDTTTVLYALNALASKRTER